jgi:carboxymethylenebutenolidase
MNANTNVADAKAFVACRPQSAVIKNARSAPRILHGRADRDAHGCGAPLVPGPSSRRRPEHNTHSPHLLIPQMKARFLIAIAANDDASNPESKNVLRKAFDDAKVPAEIEVYTGAQHGWCPPDSQVYNQVQAEKAWGRLLELFKTSLA